MAMSPLEQLEFLVQEQGYLTQLLGEHFVALLKLVQTGRAPRALKLQEKLKFSQELFQSLRQIRNEIRALSIPESPEGEFRLALEGEMRWLESVLLKAQEMLKRLDMLAGQEQMTPMGRRSIEETWEEFRNFIPSAGPAQ